MDCFAVKATYLCHGTKVGKNPQGACGPLDPIGVFMRRFALLRRVKRGKVRRLCIRIAPPAAELSSANINHFPKPYITIRAKARSSASRAKFTARKAAINFPLFAPGLWA